MKELRLASEALDEATDAADWYESRRDGFGRAFLAELDRCIDLITEHPQHSRGWETPIPSCIFGAPC